MYNGGRSYSGSNVGGKSYSGCVSSGYGGSTALTVVVVIIIIIIIIALIWWASRPRPGQQTVIVRKSGKKIPNRKFQTVNNVEVIEEEEEKQLL